MEDSEYTTLALAAFKKDKSLIGITFEYNGTIKRLWYEKPADKTPIYIARRNSKKVFWNNIVNHFSHVYIDNCNLAIT